MTAPLIIPMSTALVLGAARGGLAGAAFFVVPAAVTTTNPLSLIYVLMVSVPMGALMGLLCAPWARRAAVGCRSRAAALCLAATGAAAAWLAVCGSLALLSNSRLTGTWWLMLIGPAAVGAAAAAWTTYSLRHRAQTQCGPGASVLPGRGADARVS